MAEKSTNVKLDIAVDNFKQAYGRINVTVDVIIEQSWTMYRNKGAWKGREARRRAGKDSIQIKYNVHYVE